MNSAAWASFKSAAELGDPEWDDPIPCRECGVSPEDVKGGHILVYNQWADADMPVAVNPVTGCLCRPEDFEPRPAPTAAELAELEF